MPRGKQLPWESVHADICRHYLGDGKTLLDVQDIMLKERKFYASERAYRLKLKEWGVKRSDDPRGSYGTSRYDDSGSNMSSRFIQTSNDDITCNDDDGHATSRSKESNHTTDQQIHTSSMAFNSIPTARLHDPDDHQQRPPHTNKFEEVLRRIFEAPSTSLGIEVLNMDTFCSTEGTLLHYVAAKGRMGEILKEILLFCQNNGRSVDELDQTRSTSLHIAIKNDRADNTFALIDAGASLTMADPFGDLPLHMAIRYCSDSRIVEGISRRCVGAAKMRVQWPSAHQGQVALDLVIDRLIHEVSEVGEAICTQTTGRMFFEMIKTTPTIEDTIHLQRHARDNWKSFLQAETAVGRLSFGHALRNTMRRIKHQQEQAGQAQACQDDLAWFQFVHQELKT